MKVIRVFFVSVVFVFGLAISYMAFALNDSKAQEVSFEEQKKIEKIIHDYLLREDTRAELAKAGLISNFSISWNKGLRLNSEDGNFKLKFGGRIMNDWGWFNEDNDVREHIGDQVDGTEFRRARFYTAGTIYGNIGFKAQYEFAGGDVDFKDLYINIQRLPYVGKFQAGHFKEPFGLEESDSSKYMQFMERGLNNVFAPGRNTGFMLANHFMGKRLTAAAGMFRNSDDFGDDNGGDRADEGGYSFSGRVTGLPYYENGGKKLIHTGFSYSHQNAHGDEVRYRAKPEMHMADRFVDTGSFAAKHSNIYNPELAAVYGSFSFQTEYTFANVGSDLDDAGDSPEFSGWYAYGSYFLTGEHRKYKKKSGKFGRIKPHRNFDLGNGIGAIELTARYSELDLNDETIQGGRLADTTLGVNWYLNPNTRIMFNYVHADADIEETDDANADLFAMRFQIDF